MVDAIVIWLHVLGAVIFIGPQIFLAAVALPALRNIGSVEARQQAIRGVTRGFGTLGGIALALLLATGIWNFYDADDHGYFDFDRYFIVLQVKLTLVTLVIILAGAHAMWLGPRLEKLQGSGAADVEIARARTWSMLASGLTLVVSIAILLCAALLDADWSKN